MPEWSNTMIRPLQLFVLPLILCLLPLRPLWASVLPQTPIANGGYILYQDGRIIEQFRAGEMFIPASTIKLLTSFAVLKTLGPDFRFTTQFFLDDHDILYVRGGGDPLLTTESLLAAIQELKHRGLRKVRGYVLDASAFTLEHALPDGSENSTNPYDVANSAIAVNFNSLAVIHAKDGRILPGEELTPLTPLATEIGKQLATGRHRVNIDAFPTRSSIPTPLRYSAELLHTLLSREGVQSDLIVRSGKVPPSLPLLYSHPSSESLVEMVRSCLHVSNNFLANQMLLTAGAAAYGLPATWEKARRLLNHIAHNRIGLSPLEIEVQEGSGLSRQTRITPIGMLKILWAFEPYRELLPQKGGALLKSGTMTNVYCYAGYIESEGGPLLFAMLLNQPKNTRKELLAHLQQQFGLPENSSTVR